MVYNAWLLAYTISDNLFLFLVASRDMIIDAMNEILVKVNSLCVRFEEINEAEGINMLIIRTGQT